MKHSVHMILKRSLVAIAVVTGAVLLLGAVKTKDAKPCAKVLIQYTGGRTSGFIPETQVMGVIKENIQTDPVGVPLEKFDLAAIENALEKNAWVYDAQLYFDNTQVLHVQIDEAIPVARVIDAAGTHFYLDKKGNELPLSPVFRANVPVFTNIPPQKARTVKTTTSIIALAEALCADSFWLAQAAQIDMVKGGKMEMVPVIGNHIVDLGYAQKPEAMLQRLKLFYRALAPAGLLEQYSRIHASFEGQIVAQHATAGTTGTNNAQAMDTYRKFVNANIADVNAGSVVEENNAGRIVSAQPEVEVKAPKKTTEVKQERAAPPASGASAGQADTAAGPRSQQTEMKKPKAIMPRLDNN